MLPVWLVIAGFVVVLLIPSAGVQWWRSARDADPVAAASAPAVRPAPPVPSTDDEASPEQRLLDTRRLTIPVQGIAASRLRDTFHEQRGTRRIHKALDIMAPWGTPVLAVEDGLITKISHNRGGGLALYLADANGDFVYYYAHLGGYADGLREGQTVKRGEVIAYVGATGNAPEHAPHLHFATQALTTKGRWWGGEALNPYAALTQGAAVAARR